MAILLALALVVPLARVRTVDAEIATAPVSAARSHDWRTPGFVAAVGGQLFDPNCLPLRSAGINVPSLLYRQGLEETLAWMRRHNLRWMRVFATGRSLSPDRAPRDAAAAVAALRTLLARVEAFNAAHDASESIYVLVALTDYYPPGVPGDRHAFDHPGFRETPVLPAPWYRAGVRQFEFEQEHGFGRLTGLPNYEVYYKPWVQQVVPALAGSRALLGWQLGNELKARNSPRNGINPDQAYDWYLAFTRDMVDTIRALDQNHLILMGAQYIAELVDWEYRPKGDAVPDLVPTYRKLVQQALDACGEHCWNVWGLTGYDFNLYPLDDAAVFAQAGVASLYTEYGFTLGTPEEMRQRFGGDRATAIREGLARPRRDLDGRLHDHLWGVRDLVDRAPVAGVASWGSPAPGPEAVLDADIRRGITGALDEAALWAAWRDVAAQLEAANRAAGPSHMCRAFTGSSLPPAPRDARYFAQTAFRVDHDPFWAYFTSMGGIDTFGYPVGRAVPFLGCTTQFFQRQLLQQCGEGAPVRTMNLLDPDLLPYNQFNFSTFPAYDPAVAGAAPGPETPGYGEAVLDHIRSVSPDEFDGLPVNFFRTFVNTVPGMDPQTEPNSSTSSRQALAALANLEVWGFPTSHPQYDPTNRGFVYQRFQRGIMHFDAATSVTRGVLLADYFKGILAGQAGPALPPDLAQQAQGSRFFGQYCPARPNWTCRPGELPGTPT
ncbi:MAG: hypothetical protein HY332_00370 [Chloroflexi bacterium]|nr:hypothetical protein [Chloroflexota bacterium]